jgi:hypothetical protein
MCTVQEVEFYHPIVDGMVIVAHMSLYSVELKQDRWGPLLLLHILRRYIDVLSFVTQMGWLPSLNPAQHR